MTMHTKVDQGLCQGHGMCWLAAQEVFEVDDEGYSYALIEDVPERLQGKVRTAEQMCPESAIAVEVY